MQRILHRIDLRLQVAAGKLHGDERMGLASIAARFKIGLGVAVKADGMGLVTRLGPPVAHGARAPQVEAKLDTVAMKTPSPIDWFGGPELVVFHAHTLAWKGTVELAPAFLHLRPSAVFVCDRHKVFIISVWQ